MLSRATGSHYRGAAELADRGTLFLRNVDRLNPHAQAKLLGLLQEGRYFREGGVHPCVVDVNVAAGSRLDLAAEVRAGRFSADLYDALKAGAVHIPALRERREDVPLLIQRFLWTAAAHADRPVRAISDDALECLSGYPWPGNVGELERAVAYALAVATSDTIVPEHLPDSILEHAALAGCACVPDVYRLALRARRVAARLAWGRARGDYAEAARSLGISVEYLRRLMQMSLPSDQR